MTFVRKCHSLLGKDYRFLKLVFIVIGSCLIFDLFYTYLVVKPTYTSVERREIRAEDFPDILLCPEPSVVPFALEARGYEEGANYFLGIDNIGLRQIGWAGNNTSEDVKTVSDEISVLKSAKDCPGGNESFIYYGDTEEFIELVQFELTKALTYHRCCKLIQPKTSHPVMWIEFAWPAFNDKGNPELAFKVFLADQLTSSYFDLHKTIMLGDGIDSQKASGLMNYQVGIRNYKVKIMEDQKLEGDPNYPCIHYNAIGKYSKCIEDEMVRQNLIFLNCTPPWMTDNEVLWCKREYDFENLSTGVKYLNFLKGIGISEQKTGRCLMPCTLKKFLTKDIGSRSNNRNITGIGINFENEVEIMKSSWKIDSQTLISKIGGFIGISKNFLWLIILFISLVGVILSHLKINERK